MRVNVWFQSSMMVEGIVVQGSSTELRVAIRGWNDIALLRARGGHWVSEDNEPIVILPHATSTSSKQEFIEMYVCRPFLTVPSSSSKRNQDTVLRPN